MGNPRITTFMVALILIGLFAGIFSVFISKMSDNYGIADNSSDLDIYNKMEDINLVSEEIKDATDIEERTGLLDIIGGYFSSAYNAIRLTSKSFGFFDTMANRAIDDANLGQSGNLLRVAIGTIVLILIFVGVFLAAIFKWNL